MSQTQIATGRAEFARAKVNAALNCLEADLLRLQMRKQEVLDAGLDPTLAGTLEDHVGWQKGVLRRCARRIEAAATKVDRDDLPLVLLPAGRPHRFVFTWTTR